MLTTPVLFLAFNRPQPTKRVFEAIRAARPTRLYVAADGSRSDRLGEDALCDEVRNIVSAVDWPCELKTLFREKNLGCRVGVSTAIDWFFEQEAEGIILEDDCLPDQTFFQFCEELLERYRDDERVAVISGDYFLGETYQPDGSYFFSRYNHCWGWASWRRAWKLYDRDMSQWPALREADWLSHVAPEHADFRRYWRDIFDMAHKGKIDSWAYRWTFSCWAQDGLTILPSKNLVKNIGFEEDATHTKNSNIWYAKLPLESIAFPLKHPNIVDRDSRADRWSDLNVFFVKGPGFPMQCLVLLAKLKNKIKGWFKR